MPAGRSTSAREAVHLPQLQRVAVALGMSALLWMYVAAISEAPQRVLYPSLQVGIRNPGQGLVVVSEPPAVSIETSAPRGTRNGEDVEPRPYIDLAGLPAGRHAVPVRVESIPAAEVTSIQPPQASIVLERAESKPVPVRLEAMEGTKTADQLELLDFAPTQVTVKGPADALARVDRAVADIAVEDLAPGSTISVTLVPVNRSGRQVSGVSANPQAVVVTLPAAGTATP